MERMKYVRKYVSLTATWGNDDASSTIRISRRQWDKIKSGEEFYKSAWSWYEGSRAAVRWSFNNARFTIFGPDGFEAVIEEPLEELYVTENQE